LIASSQLSLYLLVMAWLKVSGASILMLAISPLYSKVAMRL